MRGDNGLKRHRPKNPLTSKYEDVGGFQIVPTHLSGFVFCVPNPLNILTQSTVCVRRPNVRDTETAAIYYCHFKFLHQDFVHGISIHNINAKFERSERNQGELKVRLGSGECVTSICIDICFCYLYLLFSAIDYERFN